MHYTFSKSDLGYSRAMLARYCVFSTLSNKLHVIPFLKCNANAAEPETGPETTPLRPSFFLFLLVL